jgi:hypothetical protein
MIDRQDLRDVWQHIVLIAPAPLGALIGMRYATEQTPRARTFTWLCSCALGVIVGPWMGELLAPSAPGVAVATMVSAALGMEVMAGLATAARSFASDPIAFLGKVLAIFRRGPP